MTRAESPTPVLRNCSITPNEAGQVGKQLNDDSSQHDHATIMPQAGEGPATRSVRPGLNIFGAQGLYEKPIPTSVPVSTNCRSQQSRV